MMMMVIIKLSGMKLWIILNLKKKLSKSIGIKAFFVFFLVSLITKSFNHFVTYRNVIIVYIILCYQTFKCKKKNFRITKILDKHISTRLLFNVMNLRKKKYIRTNEGICVRIKKNANELFTI